MYIQTGPWKGSSQPISEQISNKNASVYRSIKQSHSMNESYTIQKHIVGTKGLQLFQVAYAASHLKEQVNKSPAEISIIDQETRHLRRDYLSSTSSNNSDYEDCNGSSMKDNGDIDLSFLEKEAYKNDVCPAAVRDRFSLCTKSTLARNIGYILANDYGFEEIPKEFWFKSETIETDDPDDGIMYQPLNKTACEWCDRNVYSFVENRFENSVVLFSKIQLSRLILCHSSICGNHLAPVTYVVRFNKGKCSHEFDEFQNPRVLSPPTSMDDIACYFLKDDEADYGTGVFAFKTIEECFQNCKSGKQYVIQPHIRDPLLYEGRKFSVRVYGLVVSPPGPERRLNIFVYNDGYLAVAKQEWNVDDLSNETQVTSDRSLRLSEWEHYEAVMEKLYDATKRVLYAASQEFVVGRKRTWELFGLDFLFDSSLKPWLLEVNSGPTTKKMDIPMLRGLVKIGIVGVDDTRPLGGGTNMKRATEASSNWKLVKSTRARYAVKNEIAVDY